MSKTPAYKIIKTKEAPITHHNTLATLTKKSHISVLKVDLEAAPYINSITPINARAIATFITPLLALAILSSLSKAAIILYQK